MSDLGDFENDLVEQALEDAREQLSGPIRTLQRIRDSELFWFGGRHERGQPGPYSNKAPIEPIADWNACALCRADPCVCGQPKPFTQAEMQAAIDAQDALAVRVNRACAEIGREVGYRRSCYPKWVQQGRMKQEKADEQIAALEDAATLLRELSGVGR